MKCLVAFCVLGVAVLAGFAQGECFHNTSNYIFILVIASRKVKLFNSLKFCPRTAIKKLIQQRIHYFPAELSFHLSLTLIKTSFSTFLKTFFVRWHFFAIPFSFFYAISSIFFRYSFSFFALFILVILRNLFTFFGHHPWEQG